MDAQLATLPDVQKPPDDPLYFLLDARVGWRMLPRDGVEKSPADGALCLSPKPGTQQLLTDAAGTFGGLELPTGVAVDAAGGIYLLDAASGKIKRFDPCECRFESVPCTGGLGNASRQFRDPHGIAIFCGDLFVCDTGNARVQVFALSGMTLRALWLSPARADLPQPWKPYDLAFDGLGRAFVSDFANGVVHRFDRRGNWQIKFGTLGQPAHLAVSRDGRVYVVEASTGDVAVFDLDGQKLDTVIPPGKTGFCSGGIATDRAGNLYLGAHCAVYRFRYCPGATPRLAGTVQLPVDPSAIAFDLHGNLLVLSAAQKKALQYPLTAFEQKGTYLSEPLDSDLYRCQWHRIVLEGEIPQGASVMVETFTAEAPFDVSDPDSAWKTNQRAAPILTQRAGEKSSRSATREESSQLMNQYEDSMASTAADGSTIETTQKTNKRPEGSWDCLITSPPGRFLYLRLTLQGNGAVTPRLRRIKLFFPRIGLRRYLPAVFGENPVSADFTDRMLAVFDTGFRSIESELDEFAGYLDPMSTPAEPDRRTLSSFLSWLACWMGMTLDRSWDERRRRLFLRNAYLFHQLRGTLEGLRRQLLLYLGWFSDKQPCASCAPAGDLPILVLEHFKLRRWLFVGEARLGEQSVLWGHRIVNRTQLDETARVGRTQLIGTGDPVRDPFHLYAHKFSVFIPAACARRDDQRVAIERLISLGKPAHTAHQLQLVEPRFRIGFQSSIGLDSVVGCYPQGFTLGQHQLGRDTVLGREQSNRPALQIGTQSRIGTTTILD
jgi:phage tail-like protein